MVRLLLCCLLAASLFTSESFAATALDLDNELAYNPSDTILIREMKEIGNDEGDDPTSVGRIPISCVLLDSGAVLEFSFYSDLGFVTVSVTNEMTGQIESGILDNQLGIVNFPILGSPGIYYLSLSTIAGRTYHGWFVI